ncbi:10974_t:CDS:1, partial [Cetraspora pellucida]
VINENPNVVINETVQTIILRKRGFFQDVYDLMNIIKPVKDAITFLEKKDANLADCFFGLAQLGATIKLISETEHKMF